jgi:hypothetical protein
MKVKKKEKYFFVGVLLFSLFMYAIQEVNHSSLIKSHIADEYKAIVIEKYNRRKSMDVMTSVRLKKQNKQIFGIPMRSEIMNYIELGDSLIKVKDENLVYLIKPHGERTSFYYKRISMKTRNHWTFPEEWRDKWMESSAWDINLKK